MNHRHLLTETTCTHLTTTFRIRTSCLSSYPFTFNGGLTNIQGNLTCMHRMSQTLSDECDHDVS